MIRFRDLLNFPSFYAKRNSSIKTTEIVITNFSQDDESITITGKSKKYNPIIKVLGGFNLNSNVEVFCDCESFKFEFSNPLFRVRSLLHPEKFGTDLNKKPHKKNTYLIPSGCKHVISLANFFIKRKSRFL